MRVEVQPGFVALRLSRRNLESLLHMLDHRDKSVPALSGRDNETEILVLCEENETHYADRPAGTMSWEPNPVVDQG